MSVRSTIQANPLYPKLTVSAGIALSPLDRAFFRAFSTSQAVAGPLQVTLARDLGVKLRRPTRRDLLHFSPRGINDTLMSASCFGQGLQWVAMMPFRSSSSRLAHRDELVSALAARPDFLSKINVDSILRAWTEEGAETPTPWPRPSHTEG